MHSWVILGVVDYFGGAENGTSSARIKILRPLFNKNIPILDPRKVIFGHFIFLVIFTLKFPLKPKICWGGPSN